jgi:hypothetical protein
MRIFKFLAPTQVEEVQIENVVYEIREISAGAIQQLREDSMKNMTFDSKGNPNVGAAVGFPQRVLGNAMFGKASQTPVGLEFVKGMSSVVAAYCIGVCSKLNGLSPDEKDADGGEKKEG